MQQKSVYDTNPQNGEKLSSLHRDILRLAICYRDMDVEIDALLDELARASSRGKAGKIEPILSEIIAAIVTRTETSFADEGLKKLALRLDRYQIGLSQVTTILEGNCSSEVAESLATEIAERCSNDDPLVATISEFIETLPIDGATKREIRSLQAAIVEQQNQSDLINKLVDISKVLAGQLSPSSCADNPNESALKNRHHLIYLLSALEFPVELHHQAQRIKNRLEQADDETSTQTAANELTELLKTMRANFEEEIARLTEFLAELFSRLKSLDQIVAKSSSINQASAVSRSDMQENFVQHVSDIQKDMGENLSLSEMRTLVSSRLDNLTTHLNSYVVEEEKRQSQAEQQVAEMNRMVRSLESHTEQLSNDLKKQQQEVQKDPLTKIYNRAGYERALNEYRVRFSTHNVPFALAILDIDHFKRINDKFGHLAGDKVLVTLASQLSRAIRSSDTLCRYGGEEFVLLLGDTDGLEAQQVVDKLRLMIEKCNFRHAESKVPVTISCGVTAYAQDDDNEAIFARADEALYRAKNGGRNACAYLD